MIQSLVARAPRYATVGGVGLVTDLAILITLVEAFGMPVLAANAASFAVAVTQNYALNRAWTYRDRRGDTSLLRGASWFVVAAVIGLGISELVLFGGIRLGVPYTLGKLVAVSAVFVWNFGFNTLVTFRALPLNSVAVRPEAPAAAPAVGAPTVADAARAPAPVE